MKIDARYTRETLVRLVQINSINPTLAPGAPGESEIASFIAGSLRSAGLTAYTLEPEPGRTTVVGRLAGTGGGRSLMLNAHCDTVDVPGMAEPFSGAVRDGKLYGRGSFDMKGSLAACMAAAKALADGHVPLRGDVVVAAVADEEYGSLGTTRPAPARQGGWRDRDRADRPRNLPGAQGLPVDRGRGGRARRAWQQIRTGYRRQYEDGPVPPPARQSGKANCARVRRIRWWVRPRCMPLC